MLKIQLCPESELENPNWWNADAIVFCIMCALGWMAAELWLTNLKHEIAALQEVAANWERQMAEVQPIVEKFKDLDREIVALNRKISALKRITVSKVDKVKPVVVLEQLQTLRPEGMWFRDIGLDEANKVTIAGATHDSLLISEFLLGMRESMNPDTWNTDIRTQLGFTNITVKEVKRLTADPMFKDLDNYLLFEATGEVTEKHRPAMPASAQVPRARSMYGVRF